MKNLKLKLQDLSATALTREQMKAVVGGGGIKCYKCCPEDKCSSKPHFCPLACGPLT